MPILNLLMIGWERRETNSGRPYYVDHNSRTTQFTDPRLSGPLLQRLLQQYGSGVLVGSSISHINGTSRNDASSSSSRGPKPNSNKPKCANNSSSNVQNNANNNSIHQLPNDTLGSPSDNASALSPPLANQSTSAQASHSTRGTGSISEAPNRTDTALTSIQSSSQIENSASNSNVSNVRATNLDNTVVLPPASNTRSMTNNRGSSSHSTNQTNGNTSQTDTTSENVPAGVSSLNSSAATNGAVNTASASSATPLEALEATGTNNNKCESSHSNDIMVQEGLPKYKRDLVAKIKILRTELSGLQPQSGHCRLEVSRQEVFEDSYRLIVKMRPKDLRKRLMIKFKGEDGLDYGGIAREWLYLLSHEMLNPYYGLFQYSRYVILQPIQTIAHNKIYDSIF